MACAEERIAAFVAGELVGEDERAFENHLLACEACWTAVREDRLGRVAAAQLREMASPTLEDRVRMAVALAAGTSGDASGWRPRLTRRDALAMTLLAAAAAMFVWLGLSLTSGSPGDPPQMTAVASMLQGGPPSRALLAGERLVIGGQAVSVRAYEMDGREVIAATSNRAFAMPASSEMLPGSSEHAWMAKHGSMSLYGVNRSARGARSMFLISSMPAAELPQIAAKLKLI